MRQVHVAEIRNPTKLVRVDAEAKIESAHQARRIAHFARTMPGAGPVGHTQVGRDADQADIDAFDRTRQRRTHERRDLGVSRLFYRIVRTSGDEIVFGVTFVFHDFLFREWLGAGAAGTQAHTNVSDEAAAETDIDRNVRIEAA